MKKPRHVFAPWSRTRPIVIGQIILLMAEIGLFGIIIDGKRLAIAGAGLLLLAHVWSWKQAVWRHQSVVALIQTLKEAAQP